MFDFLSQYPLYIVLIIVLICWLGIFSYLVRLDKKISDLEKRLKE